MRFRYIRWRSSAAYRSGWLANRNAEPLDANPFPQNRKKKQWIRGWQDAEGASAYELSELLHNPPPKKNWIWGSCFLIFFIVVGITYPLAIIRWFITDHPAFWGGFKELIWALFPIINITYVWDIWARFVMLFVVLIKPLFQSIGYDL